MATPTRNALGKASEVFWNSAQSLGGTRNSGVLHRDAITAVDKLAVPTAVTAADVATGGSLNFNTAYKATLAAYNRWGPTTVPATGDVTTANDSNATHVARLTTVIVTGADGYDVFLSTDAAPKWVARITEAQRLAGCTVTAVGTVTATSPGANLVDVRVVGTGVASNAAPFTINNAYTPASVTAVNCAGYSVAFVKVKLAVTDLRSAPTLKIIPFHKNQVSTADYHAGAIQAVTLLTAVGEPLEQEFRITLEGSTGLVVLVDTISGQGAAASVWVELA